MLSEVRFPFISGTSVSRDFVELPSQLYEHWLTVPEVLAKHARHVETGEPMPEALVAKVKAAETFSAGFDTVEYVASAMIDLKMHLLPAGRLADFDATAFERSVLEEMGMPRAILARHRPAAFGHVFAGDGYSSGYYSYMWSEVMDADAFAAFEETGDVFHPETAEKLARHIYTAGGRADPKELYTAFRGRMPEPDAMLEKRGLAPAA